MFLAIFLEKKILFTSRIIWDITTKPHSLQKLGVDPFLVQKWTKNCKKTADFKVAKKICLTVNFLFYSKNQLFQTSSIAQIFKNQEFCHSGLSQPKNFRVRTPLSSNNEKKSYKISHWRIRTHAHIGQQYMHCTLYQLCHQDHLKVRADI